MKYDRNNSTHVKLFGSVAIESKGIKQTWKRKKTLLLLAYLMVEQRSFNRNQLSAIFWPDIELPAGLKYLRQAIYEIKQLIPISAISVDRQSIRIIPSSELLCDFWYLQDVSSDGHKKNQSQGIDVLLSLLCEIDGIFLEGINIDDLGFFDNWLYTTRESTKRKVCNLLNECIIQSLVEHKTEQAHVLLEKWKVIDEFDEHIYEYLIDLHCLAGDSQRALSEFNAYSAKLLQELDMQPGNDLLQKIEQIKRGQLRRVEIEPKSPKLNVVIPKTQYLNRDGVYIAYQTFGQGPKTLVIVSGFMSHIEAYWENNSLSAFFALLSKSARLVLFDRRGSGMSDRLQKPATTSEFVADIGALVDEVGCSSVSVLGISEGGPAAIQFATSFPDRVDNLILYGTSPIWVKNENWQAALTTEQFELWKNKLVSHWGDGSSIAQFAPTRAKCNDDVQWWARCMRLSSSPSEILKILTSIEKSDVSHLLERVSTPTLIIQKMGDRVVHFSAALNMHHRIQNSQLMQLEGEDHWMWTEQSDRITAAITGFLGGKLSR